MNYLLRYKVMVLITIGVIWFAGMTVSTYAETDSPVQKGLMQQRTLDGKVKRNEPVTQNSQARKRLKAAENRLASKYDPRLVGDLTFVSGIRDQNPWGSCWAFGAMAVAESSLLKQQGGTALNSDPFDLSERQIIYLSEKGIESGDQVAGGDVASSQIGETMGLGLNDGGYGSVPISIMASRRGVSLESDMPYQDKRGRKTATESAWTVDASKKNLSRYTLEDADNLPDTVLFNDNSEVVDTGISSSVTAIKQAVADNGAVAAGLHADTSSPGQTGSGYYVNYTHAASYVSAAAYNENKDNDPESMSSTKYLARYPYPDHMVAIVGWDDEFPKEYFSSRSSSEAPADGAFLCKNSWGEIDDSSEMLDEYFWVSYYDASLSDLWTFETKVTPQDQNVYQYDYSGIGSIITNTPATSSSGRIMGANVFTGAADQEQLDSVGISFAGQNQTVTVDIYKLSDSATSPADGDKVASVTSPVDGDKIASVTKKYTYAGYHTIDVKEFTILDKEAAAGNTAGTEKIAGSETTDGSEKIAGSETTDGTENSSGIRLNEGDKFSIVTYITGSDGDMLPVEIGYADGIDYNNVVKAGKGESWYTLNGGKTWKDVSSLGNERAYAGDIYTSYGNMMIKAFTSKVSEDSTVGDGDEVGGDDPSGSDEPTGADSGTGSDSSAGAGSGTGSDSSAGAGSGTGSDSTTGSDNSTGSSTTTTISKPVASSIVKLTKGKGKVKIRWKKVSGVKGYQFRLALNKTFKKGLKKKTSSKYVSKGITVKKLKRKKIYYVKVRTYKVVNGKTYYSNWSMIKKVKIK